MFGLGKLTLRSGPAPDFGLKKPWAEPCRSRPLRRAGIPNDHAAKRNRRQNSGGNRGPAKLVVGTLGDGTVFPKNAIFSGKVIESVARPRPNPPGWQFAWIPCRGRMDPPRTNCCRQNGFCSPTTASKTRLHNSWPGEFVDRRIYPVLQANDRP